MDTKVKQCPKCKALSPLSAELCDGCGHKFRTKFTEDNTTRMFTPVGYIPPKPKIRLNSMLITVTAVVAIILTLGGIYAYNVRAQASYQDQIYSFIEQHTVEEYLKPSIAQAAERDPVVTADEKAMDASVDHPGPMPTSFDQPDQTEADKASSIAAQRYDDDLAYASTHVAPAVKKELELQVHSWLQGTNITQTTALNGVTTIDVPLPDYKDEYYVQRGRDGQPKILANPRPFEPTGDPFN